MVTPMALKTAIARYFALSKSRTSPCPLLYRLFSDSPAASPPYTSAAASAEAPTSETASLTPPASGALSDTPKKRNPKLVNFSLPSDSESDSDAPSGNPSATARKVDKPKLPPPYNPFNKQPIVEEPDDPKNLQEVFAKIREDGLMNSAVKMFDGLSQDGLTHEALELFSQIKDKGHMPDVVAHTAVMEAYANAGQAKEAHKVYLRMLASGVLPNAYTYRVVIKALSESGDEKMVKAAKKYVSEMIGRGMRPNAGICVAVLEGLIEVGLEDEGREMVEMLKEKRVVPEENKVREVIKNKRGPVYRTITSFFYG